MKFLKSVIGLSSLFLTCSVLASQKQEQQNRKGTGTPYLVICTDTEIPLTGDDDTYAYLRWKENGYDGDMDCSNKESGQRISIKYRGASSKSYAKKQYGFEFIDSEGETLKISLANMPKGTKWVMRSPYIDRSFMRDALTCQLGRDMGMQRGDQYPAPRTDLVEVAVNGDYKGIFTLSEKIMRSPHRLDIKKIEGDYNNISFLAEVSARRYDFKTKKGTMISFIEPSLANLDKLEKGNPYSGNRLRSKIKHEVNNFEKVLKSKDFADPVKGYRSLIDVDSFVDYFLIQELTKNIDGFRRSMFFYKGDDGKFHMGPLWDFDIAYGNLNFYGMAKPEGWSHSHHWIVYPNSFWYTRLLKDPYFMQRVNARYFELRTVGNLLDWRSLESRIDSLQTQLGAAPARDVERWLHTRNYVQKHMMATAEESDTFEGNVQILKDWLLERLQWLDKKIGDNDF